MNNSQKVGWIGLGRMGSPMVEKIIKAGYKVFIWNRTRSKATFLEEMGATIVDTPLDLAETEVLFTMVSTGSDLAEVYFGESGVMSGSATPRILIDCSSIGAEESSKIRTSIIERGSNFLAAPVSGNGKCVKAGKLSAVVSGEKEAYEKVKDIINCFALRGSSFVGEGELARFCKIAHNVLLGVYTQNLAEITVLAERAGVPRHDFLEFINNSVMGSIFSQYKTPAFVNLDWTTTFTPRLLKKDLDLGLQAARELGVSMPVSAATREALQNHFGAASLKSNSEEYLDKDFSALLETVALNAGVKLEPENKDIKTGLETEIGTSN